MSCYDPIALALRVIAPRSELAWPSDLGGGRMIAAFDRRVAFLGDSFAHADGDLAPWSHGGAYPSELRIGARAGHPPSTSSASSSQRSSAASFSARAAPIAWVSASNFLGSRA